MTASQHVKIKRQSKQSKGLVVLKMMQFSKPRGSLDAATSIIFPTTGQKNLFLQFNNNGLALEDFNRCFSQIWFTKFNLRYPRSSESRGVSSSKERAGLIYGKNQLSFWSLNNLLSLLFIRAQAQVQGNYTEGKRTSTSTATRTTRGNMFSICWTRLMFMKLFFDMLFQFRCSL